MKQSQYYAYFTPAHMIYDFERFVFRDDDGNMPSYVKQELLRYHRGDRCEVVYNPETGVEIDIIAYIIVYR